MQKDELESLIFCYQEVIEAETVKNNPELVLALEFSLSELAMQYNKLYGE